MRDTTPIDTDVLSAQTSGDRALERDVLRLFADQAALIASRLDQNAFREEARGHLAADLHLLKGSALAIGATAVAFAAGTLEQTLEAALPQSVMEKNAAALCHAIALACAQAARIIDANRR